MTLFSGHPFKHSPLWGLLRIIFMKDQNLLPLLAIDSLLVCVRPLVLTIFSASLIDHLWLLPHRSDAYGDVAIIVLAAFLCSFGRSFLAQRVLWRTKRLGMLFEADELSHQMDIHFEHVESADAQRLLQHLQEINEAKQGVEGIIAQCRSLFTAYLSIVANALIYFLFSTQTSLPLWGKIGLGLLLFVVPLASFWLEKKAGQRRNEIIQQNLKINRQYNYLSDELVGNIQNGLDIRLSGLDQRIGDLERGVQRNIVRCFSKGQIYIGKINGLQELATTLLVIVIYTFHVIGALRGELSVGELLRQSGLAQNTLVGVASFLQVAARLISYSNAFSARYAFLALSCPAADSQESTDDKGSPLECLGSKIEFRNVFFRYPNVAEYTLKRVSFTLSEGETVAIVGKNGSGKSTLVKLLCRLYPPTSGEILLDGVNISSIPITIYYEKLIAVFQDFSFFAFPVGQNIAARDRYDSQKVWQSLAFAQMDERISKLPGGLDTFMYKDFEPQGSNFSGGEKQKLAIARALFTGASVMVLDEPTSALDPQAEHEITRLLQTIQNKTVLYISHRLSYCRFCSRILVLEEGAVVQCGRHKQLLREKGRPYHRLWAAQAQYYEQEA